MENKEIVIDEDFKMNVVNFLRIYGYYDGVLVKDGNDKKYVSGVISINDIILNKKDFKLLKAGVNAVLEYCYRGSYDKIEKVMNTFYKVECEGVRKKFGGFFDRY